jgi:hypothetical protein
MNRHRLLFKRLNLNLNLNLKRLKYMASPPLPGLWVKSKPCLQPM